ncbi:MAG: dihydropteroate synthase [Planctomycetota bacterium]|nr:dihydropteroate synthase [Planctomycetota bacterium]
MSGATGFAPRESFEFRLPRGRRWTVGPRPAIMGVINATPDSFSDGGSYREPADAVRAGRKMLEDGADLLDIGGESTRPGSRRVPAPEQLQRILPILRGLRAETEAPISVDTRDPAVGEMALASGADIINDVGACRDPGWIPVLRNNDVPVVLMHMRGTPEDMQQQTAYPRGVVEDVRDFLDERMESLEAEGIARDRFVLDPGIGFAKEAQHNLQILSGLPRLLELGRPLLIGASRKFFLGKLLGQGNDGPGRAPEGRDIGTVAANAFALHGGASILRVHNVPYTRDLVDVFEGFVSFGETGSS